MIIEEYVWVKWHGKNRKHFESIGYKYTQRGDMFLAKSTELSPQSRTKIKASCDECGAVRELPKMDYSSICEKCVIGRLHKGQMDFLSDAEKSARMRKESSDRIKKYLNGKKGSEHPAFKKTKTDEERQRGRKYSEYYFWQKEIWNRDNSTCQCCLKKFTSHVAGTRYHHLDGYSWAVDKRHEVNNGVFLCKECHDDFHSIYGNMNITKEQFLEWMSANCFTNFSSLDEILEFNKKCLNMTKQ